MTSFNNRMIFDIGAHKGLDTRYYISKGFFTVSIEADPVLAGALSQELATEQAEGKAKIINAGVWSTHSTLPFYKNLRNDQWSSFHEAYGRRNQTEAEVVEIECFPITEFFQRYGVPYYLKIDVEGADRHILRSMLGQPLLPQFISVEEYGIGCIDDLHALGYTSFKILTQHDKAWCHGPEPKPEGTPLTHKKTFTRDDSGLFGRDIPGEWLSYADVRQLFRTTIRDDSNKIIGPANEWWDVHAQNPSNLTRLRNILTPEDVKDLSLQPALGHLMNSASGAYTAMTPAELGAVADSLKEISRTMCRVGSKADLVLANAIDHLTELAFAEQVIAQELARRQPPSAQAA